MNSFKKLLSPFSDKSSRVDSQDTTGSTNAGSIASTSASRPSFEWPYETKGIPGLSFKEKSYASGLEGSSDSHGTRSFCPTIPESTTQWNKWDGTLLPRSPPRPGPAEPKRRELRADNSSRKAPKEEKQLLDGDPARTKSS
jgi:hypothetical protein